MDYYTCIILITLLLLVLMLGIITCNHTISKLKRHAFIAIYVLVLIALICEWLGVLVDGIGDIINLHKVVKFLEFSITPLFPVIYSRAIFSYSTSKSKLDIIPYILLSFHSILELISMHYGFIFNVDASGYYHHADYYNIYTIAFTLSAIYFFKGFFAFGKHYQNQNILVLIMIAFFIIIGVSIQSINSDFRTTWLAVGIASIFVYIYYNEIMMNVDYMTQLLNQKSYKTYIENISRPVTIMLFDVDNFKCINDTLGHSTGDDVLRSIGKTIKDIYSHYGYCYRIGGDEFCVIILHEYTTDCIEKINNIFLSKLEEMRKVNSYIPYVSIGYSHFDPEYENISDVLETADKNLYFWKNKLKNDRENLKK